MGNNKPLRFVTREVKRIEQCFGKVHLRVYVGKRGVRRYTGSGEATVLVIATVSVGNNESFSQGVCRENVKMRKLIGGNLKV